MIAHVRPSTVAQPAWHATFLSMLPTIRNCARFTFRHLDVEARAEAIQEVTAYALSAFVRLLALGKIDLAYPSVLAIYGAAQYRSGRRVGNRTCVRDVLSPVTGVSGGVKVERLDQFDERHGGWREVLVEDRNAGPAETAAARIDFAEWLRTLPHPKRRIARTLASGETTGATARKFGLSAGRVSQLRRDFADSWNRFQHGTATS